MPAFASLPELNPAVRRPATIELLMFELAQQRFALPALAVQEVVRAVWITALPQAPPIVEGVVNVRGTLAPVLDIGGRFGLSRAPLNPLQHFIIAQAGPRLVALRVDRALDLVSTDPEQIEAAGRVAPTAPSIAGIAKLPDGLVVITDLEAFLSLEEAALLEAALAQPAPVTSGPEAP